MFNSKKKEEKSSPKSSFNKSKSISSAMDDLEMGRPISKAVPDSESGTISSSDLDEGSSFNLNSESGTISSSDLDESTSIDLEESTSNHDLEIVPEVEENSEAKKPNYDNLSSFLDEDEDEPVEEVNLESEDEIIVLHEKDSQEDADEFDEDSESIFISPIEDEPMDLNLNEEISFTPEEEKEVYSLLEDEELILSRPAKKSDKSSSSSFVDKFVSRPAKKSDKSSSKFFNKFNFNFIKNRPKLFQGNKLATKSKIFAILGLIIGLIFIIYGILNFDNVSDRVIDHVLLGETGSWSIILILIGFIIILFDAFYVFYYKNSLKNANIKNAQIRSTFDTIDKIKSIDSDYYQQESDEDSIFNNILKLDKEESDNTFKNSIFKEDEIIIEHTDDDFDEIFEKSDEVADFYSEGNIDLSEDVSDSYDVGSLDDESSIFSSEEETLSNSIDLEESTSNPDLEIVPEDDEVSEPNKYDDLSSFLDDDEDESSEESKFKKDIDIDSMIKSSSETKSTPSEDLAAKKARIIEGTNFDNSLRKSKK